MTNWTRNFYYAGMWSVLIGGAFFVLGGNFPSFLTQILNFSIGPINMKMIMGLLMGYVFFDWINR